MPSTDIHGSNIGPDESVSFATADKITAEVIDAMRTKYSIGVDGKFEVHHIKEWTDNIVILRETLRKLVFVNDCANA